MLKVKRRQDSQLSVLRSELNAIENELSQWSTRLPLSKGCSEIMKSKNDVDLFHTRLSTWEEKVSFLFHSLSQNAS